MPLAESIVNPGGARIIDGRRHAHELRATLRVKATELLAKYGAPPKLTVVLVGDDAASRLYVANKSKACRDVGIESVVIELAASTPLDTLLAVIEAQNRDPSVHGILVQLPLPRHLPVNAVLEDLDRNALIQILSKPKNAIIKQYQKLFEFENVRLRFSDEALEAIADLAMDRKVGARGLRMILEDLMLDLMYYLPSYKKVREFQVTKEMVLTQKISLTILEKAG
jgi:ATP-dependent protease Clp ATPase subunit